MSVRADVIIVGAGPAGLYAAYRLKQRRVLILERADRIGGRARMGRFAGRAVVRGAGVGRVGKDPLLSRVIAELGLPGRPPFRSDIGPAQDGALIIESLDHLKEEPQGVSFRSAFLARLSEERYRAFKEAVGYTDYEEADVRDTVLYYGFDDTMGGATLFGVDWDVLCEGMLRASGAELRLGCKAVRVDDDGAVTLEGGEVLRAKCVVVATDAWAYRSLLPGVTLYRQIGANIFARAYFRSAAPVRRLQRHGVTLLGPPLQKVIRLEGNVYMVYADSYCAVAVRDLFLNQPTVLQSILSRLLGEDVEVVESKLYYHPFGTHYFEPLRGGQSRSSFVAAAQHPLPSVYVVGEAVSEKNQGWTEGAFESVEAVVDEVTLVLRSVRAR